MRKSMTGYGRGSLETEQGRFVLEIISLNRKGLDIHLHLPQELLFLDPVMRKWCAQVAERGHITIRLAFEPKNHHQLTHDLKKEKIKWERVAKDLDLSVEEITLSFLLSQHAPSNTSSLDDALLKRGLESVWNIAASAWIFMRESEGNALTNDLKARIAFIQKNIQDIEQELPSVIEMHRIKILKNLEALKIEMDSDLLAREAVSQSASSDITEEITRLKSHLEQFLNYLDTKTVSIGKTLDFLAQEMNREISTLMVKSGSSLIAKMGIEVKSEIEKIREQVQNIE
ncbi:YicC/YloC family endoribonuclease [Rhabdochlamydiaceae symbiont of Dictyostelium giganteum]|uniref:YicC/YloC family endoribonuclease n=1 Tax=Rhabdochlamydiaceae symbiont of Dictyostelium giganteum TaxID=3342349 RepID=UPI00384BDBA9